MRPFNVRITDEGVVLPVKVTPKASQEGIVGWKEGELRVKVSAPPEKGEANKAVSKLLAKTFKISQQRVVLLRGETSRKKEFLLEGITLQEVTELYPP